MIICSSPLLPPLPAGLCPCRRADAGARAGCRWELRSGGPVQTYGPDLERRCRSHLKPTAGSYRVDETYIRIKGEDRYLYRAVGKHGQTIDFLLTARRDANAAKRFLRKALKEPQNPHPRVINVDRNLGLPGRGQSPQRRWHIALPLSPAPVQVFEQRGGAGSPDRETESVAGQGLSVVPDAWRTLRGIEAVSMIRKGRARRVAKGDAVAQARFISKLFGLAA